MSETGVAELLLRLDELVRERFAAPEGALVNERQRLAVATCEQALRDALGLLAEEAHEHVIVIDLYRAANALGSLAGRHQSRRCAREIF